METAATPPPATSRIVRIYNCAAGFLDTARPLFALALRLYVARVFFISGLLKATRWDSTLALFANEYHVPALPPQVAAWLGTAAELGLPVLLLFGIGTRAAALALFVFNIVAATSYPDLSAAGLKDHILWGALLLVIAVYGPGKIAADRWLGAR